MKKTLIIISAFILLSTIAYSQQNFLYSYKLTEYEDNANFEELTELETRQSNFLGIDEFIVSATDDYNIVLSMENTPLSLIEFYVLELPDVLMPDQYEIKLEFKDVAGDSEPELLVWWTGHDGHGGNEGYDIDIEGITIIDVVGAKAILQMDYYNYYMSYTSYENENLEEEICSFSVDFELVGKNLINLSNHKEENINSSDCELPYIEEGNYHYSEEYKSFVK